MVNPLSILKTLLFLEMSDKKQEELRQVHGPNWYIAIYKAFDEIHDNSYRMVCILTHSFSVS